MPAETTEKPASGSELEVQVEGYDPRGRARGRSGNRRVRFHPGGVAGSVPGARVLARVLKKRRGVLEVRSLEVLEPAPVAVDPRCAHFGLCGGCSFQDLDYPEQLRQLHEWLTATLKEAELLEDVEVEPVLGCESPWNYRNKMDFTFSNRRWIETSEPEGVRADHALGLHIPGRYEKVLDIQGCDIQFPEGDAILNSARELMLQLGLEPWDVRQHTGLLRHLVLRKAFATGEILVQLVTSREEAQTIGPYARALLERHPEITSFVQGINTRPASIAVTEYERVLHGPGTIRERLHGLTFEISAGSFFQTNSLQAERLFAVVRELAACSSTDVVYDVCCGAGVIALILARDAREVWGFEQVPGAVEDARKAAKLNGLEHVRFVCGDVLSELVPEGLSEKGRPAPTLCVVDPPRAGLHPGVIGHLGALAPERLVYVSCNPKAAAADLAALLRAGYRIGRIVPVDMFPHTRHLECVFALERAVGAADQQASEGPV